MMITAILMAGALGAGDPDGVVATAPATTVDLEATTRPDAPSVEGAALSAAPHGLSTDDQIERWMAARTPAASPWGEAAPESLPGSLDDRKPHGEVGFGIGTGGYRDYSAAVSLPLGENGRLNLSYRQVENGYPYGYGRYGYGDPYMFDDSGYAFPGYSPGAAAEFEARVMRPDGPPRLRLPVQPERPAPE